MLAKNVINKVGRQVAYDVSGFQDREEILPFTKPFIHFLDIMEGLSLEHKTEYQDIVERIEPEDGEFRVETFSNALMDILEQTSEVQDFEVK